MNNQHSVLLTDIPRIPDGMSQNRPAPLLVWADSLPTTVLVRERVFASDQVLIRFLEPPADWGEFFATKHFAPEVN